MHNYYNRESFPFFVVRDGNWDIYAKADGSCAAIPNEIGQARGCAATHFGDAAYVRVTLGVDVLAVLKG